MNPSNSTQLMPEDDGGHSPARSGQDSGRNTVFKAQNFWGVGEQRQARREERRGARREERRDKKRGEGIKRGEGRR
eukprot:519383-Amorphochlora_amoeboformis.AAC.1